MAKKNVTIAFHCHNSTPIKILSKKIEDRLSKLPLDYVPENAWTDLKETELIYTLIPKTTSRKLLFLSIEKIFDSFPDLKPHFTEFTAK